MSIDEEVRAVRTSAGLSRADHVAVVQISGPGAFDLLQTASAQSPLMRQGCVRHTLWLRDDAGIFADVLVAWLGDAFLVLAEGPGERELIQWLEALNGCTGNKDVAIRSLGSELAVVGVDGPYSWEVVAGLLGPAVLGMPYLTLLARGEQTCLRGGKTGEYGYLILTPRDGVDAVEDRLLELGRLLGMIRVTRDALEVCALESWHFTMRSSRDTELASPLTPIELQLQWRVGYRRSFVGIEALRARRSVGAQVRATCFVADHSVTPGDKLRLGDLEVGEVLASCTSPTLGRTVGSALLSSRFAHPHLDLVATRPGGTVAVRTCSAFLVDNLSLHVRPGPGNGYAARERP